MSPEKQSLLLPVFLITIGTGWLLSTLGVAPEIDWLWTLGLAVIGVLTFVVSGLNKFTVVIGPFFVIGSLLSILRQTDRLHLDIEIPILVILAGVLMLIARSPAIPPAPWGPPGQSPLKRDSESSS